MEMGEVMGWGVGWGQRQQDGDGGENGRGVQRERDRQVTAATECDPTDRC